jgi:pyridoxal phosphate enzyme (YggS family)|tara:strand:+ start:362 stop:994 length:633 start_codon:yes stop_codon:yes gene_type:complete
MNIIDSFNQIKQKIENSRTEIIAVSKTFTLDHIKPLIQHGHKHFGENKVQEAEKKWKNIKSSNNIKLHMIGSLQSNKAKKAIELFDYIHSLDSEKLAKELDKREKQLKKKLSYFIQVNLGSEEQKGGIEIDNLDNFFKFVTKETSLSVIGLMAIPPNDTNYERYFSQISNLNKKFEFNQLSIGMSNDYMTAIKYGASFVRIGSAIFGPRS